MTCHLIAALNFLYLFCMVNRDARVMWDNKTGRSRGYGFVSFRNKQVISYLMKISAGKFSG